MCGILWVGFLSSLPDHTVGLSILGLLEGLPVALSASSAPTPQAEGSVTLSDAPCPQLSQVLTHTLGARTGGEHSASISPWSSVWSWCNVVFQVQCLRSSWWSQSYDPPSSLWSPCQKPVSAFKVPCGVNARSWPQVCRELSKVGPSNSSPTARRYFRWAFFTATFSFLEELKDRSSSYIITPFSGTCHGPPKVEMKQAACCLVAAPSSDQVQRICLHRPCIQTILCL